MKIVAIFFFLCVFLNNVFAQQPKTDSLVKAMMEEEHLVKSDKGTELILNGNLTAAGQFYSSEIKRDESSTDAYFGRGIVHLAQSDTMSACRDWSAVLALGDTATYNLLTAHCHGNMIVDDDVIPERTYRTMFKMERSNGKVLSDATKARTVVEEMPQFPGGDAALLQYLEKNVQKPAAAKSKQIKGTVYINFIITSKGKVAFPYVVRGIGKGCDEEALRVIRNMPLWKPGKQKGKPVLVRYNVPVKFN